MDFDFVKRAIGWTLILGIISFIGASYFFSLKEGLGFLAGALWGCLNLYLTQHVLYILLIEASKKFIKIFIIFLFKFPLIYGLGYGLLQSPWFSNGYLLMGFSLSLLVLLMKGYNRGIVT